MKTLVLFICLAFLINRFSYSESSKDAENINVSELISQGSKLLNNESFGEALPVWLKIFKERPNNSNVSFKLGLCYFYTLDKQQKALPFFKIASKNITMDYDFYNMNESRAPVDVIYYLAESYMAINRPDSALKYFYQYADQFMEKPPFEIDGQVRKCLNAIEMTNNPLMVKYENIGDVVNSLYPETNPVLSFDNSIIFFSSRRIRADRSNEDLIDKKLGTFYEDIYYSEFKGFWTKPVLFDYNSKGNDAPLCLSADGTKLYIRRDDGKNADIYVSEFKDGVWNKPEPLGMKINSYFNETGASITTDESILIFSSDRDKGEGGADLYICRKKGGKWGKPKNLGVNINSSGNEINPYIYPNGKKIYFSSNGHNNVNMGGYDILYSELQSNGQWSKPRNAGYPINTSGDDKFYYVASEGKRYCASISANYDYDLFEIVKGEFEALNLKPGTNIQVTQEVDVMDIVEIEREIEKEVEVKEIIETEIEIEKEVEVIKFLEMEGDGNNINPEVAKAEAEKAVAEAEKMKAEAQIALSEAQKAQADAEIAKADAEKIKAEAEIVKGEAEKLKEENAKVQAEVVIAEAEKARAESITAQANAEKAKADAEKAKADIKIKKEETKKAKYDAKIAQVGKAEADAKNARAEAEKATAQAEIIKAEAEKLKAEADENKADAEKIKAEADKVKADADSKMAEIEKVKAEAQKEQASLEKYKAEAEKAKADAEAAKVETENLVAQAQKAKNDAELAKSEAEKAKTEADQLNAEAEKGKAEAQQKNVEAEKAKAEAGLANAEAEKAKAQAEAAKAEAEKVKEEANKISAEAEKAKADLELNKQEIEKLKADAELAKQEASKLNADAENAKAAADQAKSEADKIIAEAQKQQAEADKKKADAEAAKAEAQKIEAESKKIQEEANKLKSQADKAKADAEKAKAEAEKAKAEAEKAKAEAAKANAGDN